jgi:hypothetical protein
MAGFFSQDKMMATVDVRINCPEIGMRVMEFIRERDEYIKEILKEELLKYGEAPEYREFVKSEIRNCMENSMKKVVRDYFEYGEGYKWMKGKMIEGVLEGVLEGKKGRGGRRKRNEEK